MFNARLHDWQRAGEFHSSFIWHNAQVVIGNALSLPVLFGDPLQPRVSFSYCHSLPDQPKAPSPRGHTGPGEGLLHLPCRVPAFSARVSTHGTPPQYVLERNGNTSVPPALPLHQDWAYAPSGAIDSNAAHKCQPKKPGGHLTLRHH